MRFRVTSFRVMRFRAPPVAVPGAPADPPELGGRDWDSGYAAAESQQAGLDHLIRIATEQAAARYIPAQLTTLRISISTAGKHRTMAAPPGRPPRGGSPEDP